MVELSEFMRYLSSENVDGDRLPSLAVLSEQLGISIASLREQMEVARFLGLVKVQPKKGIHRQPYQFAPTVVKSLAYATAVDPDFYFLTFAELRTHVESSFWYEAVNTLTPEDRTELSLLVDRAMGKLAGDPIQIPHAEHRELHLSIYRRLNNPFVTGILEAYWEAYEAIGLNTYTGIRYLRSVWGYHRQMVDAICTGDYEAGYRALVEHSDLLHQLTQQGPGPGALSTASSRKFE